MRRGDRGLNHIPPALGKGGGVAQRTIIDVLAAAPDAGLWDPSVAASRWQDRLGASSITPAVAEDVLGSLLDLTAFGHHRTAAADSQRPIVKNAGGLWWAENDLFDDLLRSASNVTLAMPAYVAVAAQKDANSFAGLPGIQQGSTNYLND